MLFWLLPFSEDKTPDNKLREKYTITWGLFRSRSLCAISNNVSSSHTGCILDQLFTKRLVNGNSMYNIRLSDSARYIKRIHFKETESHGV